MNRIETDLLEVYRNALYRATPALLTRAVLERRDMVDRLREPVSVICLGKCASGMFNGLAASLSVAEGFAAYPSGYVNDAFPPFVEVVEGTHPDMGARSFEAGEALLGYADRCGELPVIVLLSGGTSASLAVPLSPFFTRDDLIHANRLLVQSGLPIEKINTVRKHLSAVKGGRLGEHLPRGTLTFVLSDVSRGSWHHVGSGPTLPDPSTNVEAAEILQALRDAECDRLAEVLLSGDVPETPTRLEGQDSFLIGDNETLVRTAVEMASRIGLDAEGLGEELNGDVDQVAERLSELVAHLGAGGLLVAGGEPTVRVSGPGRGGRCSELAVRLGERLRREGIDDVWALLGSSDGVDGRTGAAGFILTPERYHGAKISQNELEDALGRSDSLAIVDQYAETIVARPTGNNLRDLFLIGRTQKSHA